MRAIAEFLRRLADAFDLLGGNFQTVVIHVPNEDPDAFAAQLAAMAERAATKGPPS